MLRRVELEDLRGADAALLACDRRVLRECLAEASAGALDGCEVRGEALAAVVLEQLLADPQRGPDDDVVRSDWGREPGRVPPDPDALWLAGHPDCGPRTEDSVLDARTLGDVHGAPSRWPT